MSSPPSFRVTCNKEGQENIGMDAFVDFLPVRFLPKDYDSVHYVRMLQLTARSLGQWTAIGQVILLVLATHETPLSAFPCRKHLS